MMARDHHYKTRPCPTCGGNVRSSQTTPGPYDWRAPRRLTRHYVQGKECPGSGALITLTPRGDPIPAKEAP